MIRLCPSLKQNLDWNPQGLSFCLIRIPVHGRVKKPRICECGFMVKTEMKSVFAGSGCATRCTAAMSFVIRPCLKPLPGETYFLAGSSISKVFCALYLEDTIISSKTVKPMKSLFKLDFWSLQWFWKDAAVYPRWSTSQVYEGCWQKNNTDCILISFCMLLHLS